MLKHNDIISALTLSQKVRMLTGAGALTGKDMKILKIPEIKAGDMKDFGRGVYPNVTALAHSWDEKIWYGVAKEKTELMRREGKNFIISPGSKIKLSPYRREISEDPFLASSISAAHSRAVAESGLISASSGYYLTKSDTDWLDCSPDSRVINEFVVSPFKKSFGDGRVNAVVTDTRELNSKYSGVCEDIQNELLRFADFVICRKATDENTVSFISRKIICLDASELALEGAVARYKKLRKSIENNDGITEAQLDEEIARCSAISPETVDESLDRLIDFIYAVNENGKEQNSAESSDSDMALKATLESAVLLKNKNSSLPLDSSGRIAIIGDIAFKEIGNSTVAERLTEQLSGRGYKVVGSEKGYDMSAPADNSLISKASVLAERCGTVLLFLGFGYEAEKKIPKTETLSLPANQLYLANRLRGKGKRVIAIISSGHAPDIEFTRDFDAVLLLPLEVERSADALAMLLSGEVCPSGKLAYTLYSGSDGAFAKGKMYRKKYGMNTGPFIGYRYYDTAKLTVGYPFGHGLSYVPFKYSSLRVSQTSVSFSVENRGAMAAAEVAEVYIGAENSPVIRPEKELCGFVRIELMPGEKKTVSLPLRIPEVYVDGKLTVLGGSYAVSVGASVSDIRLKTFITVAGDKAKKDNKRLSDYLESVSNVKEDNYTLEASYSFMKRSIRNILFGIAFIVLAISAAVFNSITENPSMFIGGLSGVLALISVLFFVSEVVERSRRYNEERARIDSANKTLFEEAEEIKVLSTDKMFREEFEAEEAESATVTTEVFEELDEAGVQVHINKDFFFANAAQDLKSFFEGRGYKLEAAVAENILASVATSRLLMTGRMKSEEFGAFIRNLSEYFGTEAFVDSVSDKAEGDSSLYSYDYHGDYSKKNLLLALESARDNPSKLVFAALDGARVKDIDEYLAPFIKYLYSPKTNNKVTLHSETGAPVIYNISPNLRLFINMSDKVSLDILPTHIATLAAINRIDYVKCQPDESFVGVRDLSRYQLDYMCEKESVKADISEDVWKRVDKIEKYAARFSDYKIGNKLWLGFEKHIGMLMAAGLEVNEALDVALSSRLISSIAIAVKDKIGEDEQNLLESVSFIFGEERIEHSKAVIDSMIFETEEESEAVEPAEVTEEKADTEEVKAEENTEEIPVSTEDKAEEITENPAEEAAAAEETVSDENSEPEADKEEEASEKEEAVTSESTEE